MQDFPFESESNTQTEHPSITSLLEKGMAVTYVKRDKLPDRSEFDEYEIELVVDVFANDKDGEMHEQRYLMFRSKKTGQEERVMISDASMCLN